MSALQSVDSPPIIKPPTRMPSRGIQADRTPAAVLAKSAARPRAPALAVAVFFGGGILLDARFSPAWWTWLIVSAVPFVAWVAAFRRRHACIGSLCLLLACLVLGGARHHFAMSTLAADDVSLFAREEPQPVHIVGTVASTPEIRQFRPARPYASNTSETRTTFQIHCRSINSGSEMQEISGLAMFSFHGELAGVAVGDTLDIRGSMTKPSPPANPGQFDYRQYLARCGTRCLLHANQPEAVRVLARGSAFMPSRWLGDLRIRCEHTCRDALSPTTAPLASALLLGSRSQISDEIRDSFAWTGTTHILAISGLNVGILAGVLWIVCRLLNLGPAKSGLLVLSTVAVYAILTGASPPVVRATVLIAVLVIGTLFHRRSFHENTLAIAALGVLLWNPADLFDVGAQLSFLAIAVISWSARLFEVRSQRNAGSALAQFGQSRAAGARRDAILKAYLVTVCIWIATTPLIASTFHLVSPVGLLLNVLLMPVITVVLWSGYAFLFLGTIFPFAAPFVGALFDTSLSGMLWIIQTAANVGLSHFHTPAPPTWWLAGFYLSFAALLYLPAAGGNRNAAPSTAVEPANRRSASVRKVLGYCTARNGWHFLAVWILVGIVALLLPPRRDGLRCTFLSVGHGCAVLVELPNGRTMLYDAGSLDGERSAERRIEGALWERRISVLDAMVISHADIDHYNAMPRLVGTFPTAGLLTSRQFLDFSQQPVREACETAAERNVPIRLISRGDRLLLDDEVSIEVLHPRFDFRSEKDNATSVVLSVEYAGRRILLTGDLEGNGLDELLRREPMYVDVLLSPHHGSRAANPDLLVGWAHQPQIVVASSGRKHLTPALQAVYGEHCRVFSTADTGAVTVEITPDGEIRESQFLYESAGTR